MRLVPLGATLLVAACAVHAPLRVAVSAPPVVAEVLPRTHHHLRWMPLPVPPIPPNPQAEPVETSISIALNVPPPVPTPQLEPESEAGRYVVEELPPPPHPVQPYTVVGVKAVAPDSTITMTSPSAWLRELGDRIASVIAPEAAAGGVNASD